VPYPSRELAAGQPAENQAVKVDVEVDFDGHLPAFFYPSVDNTTWGVSHYEQHGRVSGTIRCEDAEYRIDGRAFRDHTRGPRNLSRFAGSNWIQGELPDGRGFVLFQVWSGDTDPPSTTLDEFTLVGPGPGPGPGAGAVERGRLVEGPGLDYLDDVESEMRIVAETSSGRLEIIGRPRNTMVFSCTGDTRSCSASPGERRRSWSPSNRWS